MSESRPGAAEQRRGVVWPIAKGMFTTFKQIFRKDVTEQYPKEIVPPPPRAHMGRHRLNRADMHGFFRDQAPATVLLEGCGSAHYCGWAHYYGWVADCYDSAGWKASFVGQKRSPAKLSVPAQSRT